MSEVKRYGAGPDVGPHEWSPDCRVCCDQYILASDYDALTAENARLRAVLEKIKSTTCDAHFDASHTGHRNMARTAHDLAKAALNTKE